MIFTCLSTPLYISFHTPPEDGIDTWTTINVIVDIFFAVDIIVNYFSAFYDDDYSIVENIKDIARYYFFGWFFIDLCAIIPFDSFSSSTAEEGDANINAMVRIAKLGRM